MWGFILPVVGGAIVGGITSVVMGGDFLKGAFMGALTGGTFSLIGSALASAGTVATTAATGSATGATGAAAGATGAVTTATIGGTTVSAFGFEMTKSALYSLAGAALGGLTAGMNVAQQSKAEKRMRQEQEAYARRERELRAMEQRHSEEARKSMANFEEGSRREIARRGAELRSADDANTAFWRYLNEWGNDNRTLSDVVEEQYIQSAYA